VSLNHISVSRFMFQSTFEMLFNFLWIIALAVILGFLSYAFSVLPVVEQLYWL